MLADGEGSIVALNRAAGLSHVDGLAAMEQVADELDGYLYHHSARGELLRQLGRFDDARTAYRRALGCQPADAEAAFLERRLTSLGPAK